MKGVELKTGDVLLSEPYASRNPLTFGFHKAIIALPQGRTGKAHAAIYDKGHIIESDIRTGVVRVPFDRWRKANNFEVYRPKMAPKAKDLQKIRAMVGADYNLSAAIKAGVAPWLYKSDQKNGIICSGVAGNLYPQVAREKRRHPDVVLPAHFAQSKHMKKLSFKHTFSDEAARNAQWALDAVRHGNSKAMLATGKARARQLANKQPVSMDVVRRIAAFKRHQKNKEGPKTPQNRGFVAWQGWGGDAAILREAPAVLAAHKKKAQIQVGKPPAPMPKIKPPSPPTPNLMAQQRADAVQAHQVGSFQMAQQKKLTQNMDEVWRNALLANRAAVATAGGGT